MRRAWRWSAAETLTPRPPLPARPPAPPGERVVVLPSSLGTIALLLALAAAPASAATLLERTVEVDVRADGRLEERVRLAVRLDSDDDWRSWSPYPIWLDEHRKLLDLSASVARPDGTTARVGRRDLDTVQVAGDGILHSSDRYRTVSFPAPLPKGSVLALEYAVEERPYFPARSLPVAAGLDAVERLRVVVRGEGLRWRLDGGLPGLEAREVPGGVEVSAAAMPRREVLDLAPGQAPAVLRVAWGPEAASWAELGRWYEGLLAGLPRAAGPVRARARAAVAGRHGRREQLEALLDLARREVRYVAVEVGIGGYRPSAPEEVLARRWGDCKDKALLLVDLLAEVGIEAYPALVLAGDDRRVDLAFPDPGQFNHAIAAVPISEGGGFELPPDAPVADGYLFLDATQQAGGLAWLHPWVQDQAALVVRPGGASVLVRTPIRHRQEVRRLDVEVAVSPTGEALGQVRLEVSGKLAASFRDRLATMRPDQVERDVRLALGGLLPGAAFEEVRWATPDGPLPAFGASARVRVPGLLQGGGADVSFQVPGLAGTPVPRLLDGRAVPVVVSPTADVVTWRIALPRDGCTAEAQDVAVANDLGSVRQSVAAEGGRLVVERRTELARRWIEPADFAALKELSLAEHRALKRRVRASCGG